jgi:ATP-binding cassette subfamily C (CFTR/MRP) protein 4
LWDVLEKVNLKEYVENLSKGLETEVEGNSSVFSAGQKQLVCLARVILKKKKIMIFDEATANVDYTTDNLVQARISEQFRDCTVITVAHRLTTIAHYDKIMLLEKGQMIEFDHPYVLLVRKIGDKSITRTDGLFAQMVLKNEADVAEKIFRIAYDNYPDFREPSPKKNGKNE